MYPFTRSSWTSLWGYVKRSWDFVGFFQRKWFIKIFSSESGMPLEGPAVEILSAIPHSLHRPSQLGREQALCACSHQQAGLTGAMVRAVYHKKGYLLPAFQLELQKSLVVYQLLFPFRLPKWHPVRPQPSVTSLRGLFLGITHLMRDRNWPRDRVLLQLNCCTVECPFGWGVCLPSGSLSFFRQVEEQW